MNNEEFKEAIAISNKLWAFFVGFSWDNSDADELIDDAAKLRRLIEKEWMCSKNDDSAKSSSLIPRR